MNPVQPSAGPWRVGLRRLRANRWAIGAVGALVLVGVLCALAPAYAHLAGVNPFEANPAGTVLIDGRPVRLLQPAERGLGVLPIGPTWDPRHYLLGADRNGRDVAARVLYGGRNTLLVGFSAALVTSALGLLVGLVAGYFRGVLDGVLTRVMDVLWAFPVLLLAISLAAISFNDGLDLGVARLRSGSLLLPVCIIALIYVPYLARPVRGSVLALVDSEFVAAATSYGAGHPRVLAREILPNVLPRIVVLYPVMVANAMLLESGLSFLGIGVRPPEASWGTIVQDGLDLLRTRPLVAVVPGVLLTITVCSLNMLGDAVQDAFDPKAELKGRG